MTSLSLLCFAIAHFFLPSCLVDSGQHCFNYSLPSCVIPGSAKATITVTGTCVCVCVCVCVRILGGGEGSGPMLAVLHT